MKDQDIVIIGQQDWDIEIGSNCKNIALELSKNNRVLYINNPLDRRTILQRRNEPKIQKRLALLKKGNHIEEIHTNLWNLYPATVLESINWIKYKPVYNFLNKINNRRFSKSIEAAVENLGFKNYILFNDNLISRAFYLDEWLKPSLKIYYLRDNLNGVSYFKKAMIEQEQLIHKWDLTFANSDYLADYARAFNKHAYMVGQGCDLSIFEEENIEVAQELRNLNHPIIGYTGFLTGLRLDIEMLEYLAKERPQWNIVLVGPEDKAFEASALHQLPNVHFLGNKRPESLPHYIQAFDVAINPQLVNETTVGNYPRKIDEYLAMGKPVVATRTPFMDYFKAHTYLPSDKKEFIQCIEVAMLENSIQKEEARKSFAQEHTWEKNVKKMYTLIEENNAFHKGEK
ncbi:MAG: glycosyl transferase family 1 [Cytophagaceae bacterium]|jgi:glycosyltransferase involved in cell wall biosynthesis|nr:glycosyl transferase family 1 [Cytophagaceae bacterium]